MAVRVAHRVLSLPVRPDALALMFRRDALGRGPVNGRLPGFPIGRSRYEWLLAAVVGVNADGWPIVRVAPAGPRAPADATTSWATLRRLWLLRNSAFSADYDERAYNSWIPLQRYWQRARYRIITNLVDRHSRILDIGCGSSRIVQALPHAVGLDIQLKKLRRISGQHHRLVQATLTRLPFRDGAFDTLICSQVIEHVPESLVDWREFNRVLAPGGSFVVGTPDYATVAWPAARVPVRHRASARLRGRAHQPLHGGQPARVPRAARLHRHRYGVRRRRGTHLSRPEDRESLITERVCRRGLPRSNAPRTAATG